MSNFLTLKQKVFLGVIGILFLLNIFVWKEVFILAGPHYLKVDILDIGQGDAIFIETPDMRHILIDGGPDLAVLGKLAKLLLFFDKSLDVVILTHSDQDHLMGLLSVLQKYHVKNILWTGIARDGGNYQKWLELIEKQKQKGSNIVIADLHTKIKSGEILIDILNPIENLEGRYFNKTTNETGIVSRLIYSKKSFLFTADVSSKTEQQIIDLSRQAGSKVNLSSDILKVSHHGSKYSSSEEFLQAVHPSFAVISVGKDNSYGHPTPEVLQKLQNFGIKILRTDQNGDVEILSDGENLKIK